MFSPDARRTLWLTGLAHGMSHSWELVFPAVAIPMAADLGLPYAEVVTLSFLSYLLFGLGAVPAGWMTDKIGGRTVLLACMLGGGVSGLLVAASGSRTALVLSLGGLGLAASLYHPAGLAVISHRFDRKLGRAFAINGIAGNLGIAATPLLAGLLASVLGWRWAYAAMTAPALLAGLVFLALPIGPDRADAATDATENATGPDDSTAAEDRRLRIRALVLLAVAVVCGGLAYRLQTLVVPALIGERIPALAAALRAAAPPWLHDVENLTATALTSIAYAMGIFGQWWGGKVADRGRLPGAYLAFHAAALPCAALAAWLGGPALILALVGYLFFNQGMQPIENRLVVRFSPSRWRGRVFAGKFLLALGVGSTGVFIVAALTPRFGLGSALAGTAVFEGALVTLAAALWLVSRRSRRDA